jgi:hypothetical protein
LKRCITELLMYVDKSENKPNHFKSANSTLISAHFKPTQQPTILHQKSR